MQLVCVRSASPIREHAHTQRHNGGSTSKDVLRPSDVATQCSQQSGASRCFRESLVTVHFGKQLGKSMLKTVSSLGSSQNTKQARL